jgi:hypothetical protein
MATGPEHYLEAEAYLVQADHQADAGDALLMAVIAQVHSTLSLAAATALGHEGEGRTMPSKDRAAWFDAAAECRKATA